VLFFVCWYAPGVIVVKSTPIMSTLFAETILHNLKACGSTPVCRYHHIFIPFHRFSRRDAVDTLRYRIQYKEYLQSWEEAAQVDVPSGQNRMVAALPDLQPCATYCVRLVAVDEDGLESPPGPEIFVDTQGKDGGRTQVGGK